MSVPVLTTARLRLRAVEPRDRALYQELYGDTETMRYIGRPVSHAENAASFRATLQVLHRPRKPQFLAIVRKRDWAAIGICSIRRISRRERTAEVGIMLVRSALRRGYGTEALGALIGAALRALPIDAVWVQYQRANTAIACLIDTLGFSAVGDWRPRGVMRKWCVAVLRQSGWHKSSDQRGEYCMSNIIGFLENAGRDAAMRHTAREQLLQTMKLNGIATERSSLEMQLGARETMYASNEKITPPKKKPAKKAPAKKPVKKAPAKKK